MAKYTVKFACGHEETINLTGPMKERDARIAYLQEHGTCTACRRSEFTAKVASNSGKFPVLEGTEKQVAWAMDIRQRWIDEVDSFFASKGGSWEETTEKFAAMPEDKKDQLLALPVSTNALCKFAHVITETAAKYYIENR